MLRDGQASSDVGLGHLFTQQSAKPATRARERAAHLFDKGLEGVFTAEAFLTRPLPTCGFKMARLPDNGNRLLAALLHVFEHTSPAMPCSATTAAADAALLAIAPDLLREYDDLIAARFPPSSSLKGIVHGRVALVKRACKVIRANRPSLDRISSRNANGTKRNHIDNNMRWASWWFNSMTSDGSCMRAQIAVVLVFVHLFADVTRVPPDIAADLQVDLAALKEKYATSGNCTSGAQLVPAAAAATLADFCFASESPTPASDEGEAWS